MMPTRSQAAVSENLDFDISSIAGNAPLHVKQALNGLVTSLDSITPPEHRGRSMFGTEVYSRLKITEVSILKKVDEESKLEGRVVVEAIVEEDMVNILGSIHGRCSAFLVDMCSVMSLFALSLATTGKTPESVSQSINMIYHSPAALGEKIRLVNTSITLGNRRKLPIIARQNYGALAFCSDRSAYGERWFRKFGAPLDLAPSASRSGKRGKSPALILDAPSSPEGVRFIYQGLQDTARLPVCDAFLHQDPKAPKVDDNPTCPLPSQSKSKSWLLEALHRCPPQASTLQESRETHRYTSNRLSVTSKHVFAASSVQSIEKDRCLLRRSSSD
ncbi:hypothetical protein NMY22_g19500 [Coprinellus aureogranulatus]|nr:hypothetical protein NMY22_g19500 [Coprinellus aureogranulatus]